MKTEGLNFLEALQVLEDKKYKKIKSCYSDIEYELRCGILCQCNAINTLSIIEILNKWTLVDVKPSIEERSFTLFVSVGPGGLESVYRTDPGEIIRRESQHFFEINRTYIFTYPEGIK